MTDFTVKSVDDNSATCVIPAKSGHDTTLEINMLRIDPEYLWDRRYELHKAIKEGERVMATMDDEKRLSATIRLQKALRYLHDHVDEALPYAVSADESGECLKMEFFMFFADLDEDTRRRREVTSIAADDAREKSEVWDSALQESDDLVEVPTHA
jgi:hypothetical protein